MGGLSERNFGLLIAYVLPGIVCLAGLSPFSPMIRSWLAVTGPSAPSVAGFCFVTLAALAAGLVISAVRWATVDTIHHRTGVTRPVWEDAVLAQKLDAFDYIVENHYRYYQFYANMLVALPFSYAALRVAGSSYVTFGIWSDLMTVVLCGVLFAGSRDALRKYYRRSARLLGEQPGKETNMTNGNHHAEAAGAASSPRPSSAPKESVTQAKPPHRPLHGEGKEKGDRK